MPAKNHSEQGGRDAGLRQQAVNIISIRLWSAPAAELDSWLEVMSLLEVL